MKLSSLKRPPKLSENHVSASVLAQIANDAHSCHATCVKVEKKLGIEKGAIVLRSAFTSIIGF